MPRLTIELKQHTPLIHFQYDQDEATLRASEVKPRLDLFMMKRIGLTTGKVSVHKIGKYFYYKISDDEFEEVALSYEKAHPGIHFDESLGDDIHYNAVGNYVVHKKQFFLNNGAVQPALNYKLRISTNGKSFIKQTTIISAEKYELFNESLTLTFLCSNTLLAELIKESISEFFTITNFGFRQSKGYGSFSVKTIKIDGEPFKAPNTKTIDILRNYFYKVSSQTLESFSISINRFSNSNRIKLSKEDEQDEDKKQLFKKAANLTIAIPGTMSNSDFVFRDYSNLITDAINNKIQSLNKPEFKPIASYRESLIERLNYCLSLLSENPDSFRCLLFEEILTQRINSKYQLYKSGRNMPYNYKKSKMRDFWGGLQGDKDVVYWDKRFMKQRINSIPLSKRDNLDLKCCSGNHNKKCELYDIDIDKKDRDYTFIRALIGLEGAFFFQTTDSNKKFVVSVKNPDLERFQSIITFIVKDRTIYTCLKSPQAIKQILNKEFGFELTIKDERSPERQYPIISLGNIQTPELTEEQIGILYGDILRFFSSKY